MRALLLITSILSISLIGCFSGEEDVRDFVANIKKTSKGKVNELPPAKVFRNETFTARDLRSPFEASSTGDLIGSMSGEELEGKQGPEAVVHAPRPDAARKREYLERYPLEQYTMVGTLSKDNFYWGLVQDKSGLIVPVKVGDCIGLNSGRVLRITDEEITLVETIDNGEGGWMDVENALILRVEGNR